MKAVRIHEFGSTAEVLRYEEAPIPEPGPDELLIKIEAASLNRADLTLRKGAHRIAPDELPIIPGREFAGTVAKLGAGVQDCKVGERVVACPGRGGYAEYALAKLSETLPVPHGLDSATAAATPTVFLTAWFALVMEGRLKGGEWLLVQAGSSGVGMAAIQIAKHLGAKVIATSSSDEKCKRLRQLGADEALDYTKQNLFMEVMRITTPEGRDHYQERHNPDVMEGVNVLRGMGIDLAARRRPFPPYRGVGVVLEMIGGDIYQKSLQVLAPGGRLVSLGGAFGPVPDPPPSLSEGRKASRFSITNHLKAKPEDFRGLANLLKLVQEKKIQVIIDRSFPLAEARAAQRHLEGRGHFGKVVLTMS
jgi:NADPH:quinone reductase-like Zn-dependent oxidoreductase